MLEFTIVVILANLVMLALLYFLRHAIAIRAPVLFIAVGISIIYCILYPLLAAQMHYPKVLYLYVFLIMAGAGALYYIENKFFSARGLKEGDLTTMPVGEALAAMEGVSGVQRANKLAVFWESIVNTIKASPGIRKESQAASGVYALSGNVDTAEFRDTAPDEQVYSIEEEVQPEDSEEFVEYAEAEEVEQSDAKYRKADSDYEVERQGYAFEEAAQPEDAEEAIEFIAAEDVTQGDSVYPQADSELKAEVLPEEVEEFVSLGDEVAILSVESEDKVPDEQGYILEEAAYSVEAEDIAEYIAAEEVGQGAFEYQQEDLNFEAEAGVNLDGLKEFMPLEEQVDVSGEVAQPEDEQVVIIDYIEAETSEEDISGEIEPFVTFDEEPGESIDEILSAEKTGQEIPEDFGALTATLEVSEMIASADEIPIARSGAGDGTEAEYIIGSVEDEAHLKSDIEYSYGDTYNEAEIITEEQYSENQMTAQEDEISVIVAKAFDILARGDSAGAVNMFFKALKMGPPPRLAVLLCTRISSIYMAQGLKRQALSTMEMLEVVWGPSLEESELKGIKSIIIQLRGEV